MSQRPFVPLTIEIPSTLRKRLKILSARRGQSLVAVITPVLEQLVESERE